MRGAPALLALHVALVLAACNSASKEEARRREFPFELIEGEPMYTVLMPDGIPSIDEPTFVTAAEADAFLAPDEPVMGVVGPDGTAKAYSAWQLDGHEIVNDEIDGIAIACTW